MRFDYNQQQTLVLIGHTASRFGDQAWNFIVPLVLIVVSHGALWVASFYAICGRLVILACGSRLGLYIDSHQRIQVVRNGAVSSVCSVSLVTCLFALFLYNIDTSSCFQGSLLDWLFQYSSCSWKIKSLFTLLSLLGSGEVIGAFLTRVSVERDWIVEIVEPDKLSHFNSLLRRIDLLSEILAPVFVGWFIDTRNSISTMYSLIWVGVLNMMSFLMEYGMLRYIYSIGNLSSKSLTRSLLPNEDNVNEQTNPDSNYSDDLAISSFLIFIRHPLFLVVLAYGCLWFNATSPHGILLTSYLAEQHVSNTILGIFRASGALFGFLGTLVFPWLEKFWGLKATCLLSILWETTTLTFSCILIWLSGWGLFLSLSMIVLSRVGLYAYELGESLYLQRYTEPTQRGRMGAVEGILTNAANLGLLTAGLVLNEPRSFLYLWISSAIFAALGSLLFIIWCKL